MTAAFLGAPAIATDLESGVAQAMLARPIRRSDLVVGRGSARARRRRLRDGSALLEIVAIGFVSGYYPPHPLAPRVPRGPGVVLLTLALLLSTRCRRSRPARSASCCSGWLDGRRVRRRRPVLRRRSARHGVRASRWLLPSDGLWRGTIYASEPPP
jgi:hypothetical protein